jgi:quercetin dioxygenase-like cupin family protein
MRRALAALALPLLVLAGASAAAADKDDRRKKQTITRSQGQASAAGSPDTFTGDVRVDTLFPADVTAPYSGAYVTFQPGARSAWHTHPAGQRLVVTEQLRGLIQVLRNEVGSQQAGNAGRILDEVIHDR